MGNVTHVSQYGVLLGLAERGTCITDAFVNPSGTRDDSDYIVSQTPRHSLSGVLY